MARTPWMALVSAQLANGPAHLSVPRDTLSPLTGPAFSTRLLIGAPPSRCAPHCQACTQSGCPSTKGSKRPPDNIHRWLHPTGDRQRRSCLHGPRDRSSQDLPPPFSCIINHCRAGWTPPGGRPASGARPPGYICSRHPNARPALLQVLEADMPMSRSGHVECSLVAKLDTVTSRGCEVALHWLPSHCGIEGNKEADTLTKGAHEPSTPMCTAISALDGTQAVLNPTIPRDHPHGQVACGNPPQPFPHKIECRERAVLLRLRLNCANTAARLHHQGRAASPACTNCSEPEMTDHALRLCPHHVAARSLLEVAYRHLGLPTTSLEALLFPRGTDLKRMRAFRSLLRYLESTGLHQRL